MKKTFLTIIVLIIIGCLLALGFNYYVKNFNTLYNCKIEYDGFEDNIYTFDKNINNGEKKTCNDIKKFKSKTVSIIGNNNGFKFNERTLLLLYDKKTKTVTIYDTNGFNIYDTIKDVIYDDKSAQRNQSQVALYNDGNLFAFVFPKMYKDSNYEYYAELLYNIDKKQKMNIENNQEFCNLTFRNYYNAFLENDVNSTDKMYSQSKYITNINNGLIDITSGGKHGIYDLVNDKYIVPLQEKGYFIINNGLIFIGYDDNKDVKFYSYDGRLLFSKNDSNFKYKYFNILCPLSNNLILLLGHDFNNNIVLLNGDGSLNKEYNININTFKNDILNKINNSKIKNELKFSHVLLEYYSYSSYNLEKNEITLTFNYENSYYNVNEYVTYTINLNNNTIN